MRLTIAACVAAAILITVFLLPAAKPPVAKPDSLAHQLIPVTQRIIKILGPDESTSTKYKRSVLAMPAHKHDRESEKDSIILSNRLAHMMKMIAALEAADIDCEARLHTGIDIVIFFTNEPSKLVKVLYEKELIEGFVLLEEDK